MVALSAQFDDLAERGRDGFGRQFEGTRSGVRMLIRVLAGRFLDVRSDMVAQRAAEFVHPVVYRVEQGQADDAPWLAVPADGVAIASLAASDSVALLPAVQCIDVALGLIDAVIVSSRAQLSLGPLLPSNVYVDPARPGWVRVFPMNLTIWRSIDWLEHAPDQLMFVDRHTLRERPTVTSTLFSIAALSLLLLRGRQTLPSAGSQNAIELIVHVIENEHPLVGHVERVGSIDALISEVTAGIVRTPEVFRDRLLALKESYDPVARARLLRDAQKPLEAIAQLHRALKDGDRSPRVYLLKAQLEAEQGHSARAAQSLRDARVHAPQCRMVLERLAKLTVDPAEALDALREASRLEPIDGDLRMAAVEAAAHLGDMRTAFEHLAAARAIATAEPCARHLWTRIAAFLFKCGLLDAAIEIAERHTNEDVELDVRTQALEIVGRVRYKKQEFEPAVKALREALRVIATIPRRPSIELLNELAFSLVGVNATAEAIAIARQSLMLDPVQPQIIQFLAAVS